MNSLITKYNKIYLKSLFKLILYIMVLPIALLFLILSFFYDTLPYDFLFVLAPIPLGLLFFIPLALYVFRFNRLIKLQEKKFNIKFNDDGATPVWKNSLTFISDGWLIFSGTCAFYRKYVKSFSVKSNHKRGYRVTINTIDKKKYKVLAMTSDEIKKYREWRKKDNH